MASKSELSSKSAEAQSILNWVSKRNLHCEWIVHQFDTSGEGILSMRRGPLEVRSDVSFNINELSYTGYQELLKTMYKQLKELEADYE